jgi:hypothetical protein
MSLKLIKQSRHCLTDLNSLCKVKTKNGYRFVLSGKGIVIYWLRVLKNVN